MAQQVNTFKRVRNRHEKWWKNLKRDYHDKFEALTKQNNNKNLTIDGLTARRKLEQLKLLTTTDLDLVNSAEPFRIPSYILFKKNLLDVQYCGVISGIYLFSYLLTRGTSNLIFVILFISLFLPIHRHIQAYRSFAISNQCADILSRNAKLRRTFLSTHLGHNSGRTVKLIRNKLDENVSNSSETSEITLEVVEESQLDTFHWINQIVLFFWPYLSHLIHFELNKFFQDQIESGTLGRSRESSKRLCYAIIRQLKANILVIENCQLGDQAPYIKNLTAYEEMPDGKKEKQKDNVGKKLVYNLNFDYEGDMNMSVIYRYFCCCSQRMGLEDVFLRFNIRVEIGPIKKDIPFIDQLSITLLELPQYGYRGIALAELAELRIVRNVINGLIKDHILFPRAVTIQLGELLEALLENPPPKKRKGDDDPSASAAAAHPKRDVSFMTRLMAQTLLCGCMCSNMILRCCQGRAPAED